MYKSTLAHLFTTDFSMVIPSSDKHDTFPYCIYSPQKLCLLKILIKSAVNIKMFNTTENDEMGLQKINRPRTGLSPSRFCDGENPCIVTRIHYSWNPAVIKVCFKDYTQILHAVFINNNSSTIIQIVIDSVQLKYALLMSTEIFGVSQYSTSPTKVYSITTMIVGKVRNFLIINTCIFRQTFLKIMFHTFVHEVYSHLHENNHPTH